MYDLYGYYIPYDLDGYYLPYDLDGYYCTIRTVNRTIRTVHVWLVRLHNEWRVASSEAMRLRTVSNDFGPYNKRNIQSRTVC